LQIDYHLIQKGVRSVDNYQSEAEEELNQDLPAEAESPGDHSELIEAETVNRRPPLWGPWATIGLTLALLLACTIVDVIVTVAFLAAALVKDPKLDMAEAGIRLASSGLLLSVDTIIRSAFCTIMIWIFIATRRQLSVKQYLGLVPVGARKMALWLSGFFVLAVLIDVFTNALGMDIVPEFMLEAWRTAGWLPLLWVSVIVIAPLVEEIVFRGFLFVGLQQFRHGNIVAVLVTSLLWALIHLQYNLAQMSLIFFLGILLGIARIRTRSLWVPVAMHMLNNLVATVEAGLTVSG
jgi:membrane protease YdiL (CAAX protease family)